jgi:hypothetical protein
MTADNNVGGIRYSVDQLIDMNNLISLTIGEQIQSCDEMLAFANAFFEGTANENIKTAIAQIPVLKRKLEEARAVTDVLEESALTYKNGL